jgi:4-diphosphocytidyl-2-C-methyl-D-erythritol kinase
LQAPAEALNSDVTRLKQQFAEMPVLGHLMSGSGTSYFGLCANRRHALQVSARLKAARVGQVFVAQSRP